MLIVAAVIASLVLAGSLPYWLPAVVVAIRMRIFTAVNGAEGVAIPGKLVDASHFKDVYSHPAADGRSRGAALSDLFWYWLSPGPQVHQEHLEPGEHYREVARATGRILAVPKTVAEALTTRCVSRILSERPAHGIRLVRLRDLFMPVWAEFYYQLVFGEPCPAEARALIVANANDVATALKCCSLRHMKKRERLTRFLIDKVESGRVPHTLSGWMSTEERAFYLQGTFFNTAVVQMSEAMVHLLMVIAQHPDIQSRLTANSKDDAFLDRVIAETLRLYPLFGISHRITSGDIAVDERTTIPKGSVLCFNHPEYHRTGFDDPDRFNPDRWLKPERDEAHYVPFGVAANRPCPAQGLAPVTMRAAVREVLGRFAVYSSVSHTRSIPSRGPCLLVLRTSLPNRRLRSALLMFMRFRDRWEDVGRSLVQLTLGTYMVWDARHQRLCERFFEGQGATSGSGAASACPVMASPIVAHHPDFGHQVDPGGAAQDQVH
jgi:hypothetical protein